MIAMLLRRLVASFAFALFATAAAGVEPHPAHETLWGNYRSDAGDEYIVGRAPGGSGDPFLYDFATRTFAPLHAQGGGWCAEACRRRVTPSDGAIDIDIDGRGVRAAKQPIALADVAFAPDGVALAGRVWTPATPGRHPAVVLIGGTGCDLRDDFRIYPYLFVRAGYVVAAYDKRGCGASAAPDAPVEEGIAPLAEDALAAVAALRARADVDADRVGVLGISHGAWVALEAVRRDARLAFAVPVVGGGVPLHRAFAFEVLGALRAKGHDAAAIAQAQALLDALFDRLRADDADAVPALIAANAQRPWFADSPLAPFAGLPAPVLAAVARQRWASELSYDPSAALKSGKARIFAIAAQEDAQVPGAENLRAIRDGAGTRADGVLLVGADHGQAQRRDGDTFAYAANLTESLLAWLAR